MNIKSSKQVSNDILNVIDFDIIIHASGYEKRCTALANHFHNLKGPQFVLRFTNHTNNFQHKANDSFFQNKGYNTLDDSGDSDLVINNLLDEVLYKCQKKEINILLDYSSMTSVWYSSVIQYFINLDHEYPVKIYFNYSYAKFTPASENVVSNKFIGPLQGFSTLSIPDKPTALMLGIGYERDKAFGLSEYLDAETFIFYSASENYNKEYAYEVERQNKSLLSDKKKENIFTYPIYDLNTTQNILYTVCLDNTSKYRIILAPCGPKPFTLISLITSIRLGNADVWRISSGENDIYERESNGRFSVFECIFETHN